MNEIMTDIKAIECLEQIDSRIGLKYINGEADAYVPDYLRKSVCVAIQAIREKLEREKCCEYCNFSDGDVGSSINNVGDNFVMIKSDNEVSIATDDKHFSLLKIRYCPMCGRKLTTDIVNVNKIEHIGEANNML